MSTSKPEHQVLGLLGGTFDPVHYGHLALAQAALASGAVQRLRWIPAGQPPHRAGPAASAEHRLAMVRIAIADCPAFALDAGEVEAAARGEPSYTISTLERLRRELGAEQPLALVLGADAFLGLASWHRWQEIPPLAHLLVTTRPGFQLDAAIPPALRPLWVAGRVEQAAELRKAPGGGVFCFNMPPARVSATAIRRLLPDPDAQLAELLPPDVVRYIRHHHLYS